MAHLIDKDALVVEIERIEHETNYEPFTDEVLGKRCVCRSLLSFINTLEVKEVDYERELSKYLSDGIHRFFPNVGDDYCKMDSVIWQDYVIEIAKHFFELGVKINKGERL